MVDVIGEAKVYDILVGSMNVTARANTAFFHERLIGHRRSRLALPHDGRTLESPVQFWLTVFKI